MVLVTLAQHVVDLLIIVPLISNEVPGVRNHSATAGRGCRGGRCYLGLLALFVAPALKVRPLKVRCSSVREGIAAITSLIE